MWQSGLLRSGNKTGLGDLRSAVPAGSETRAEQFCYGLEEAAEELTCQDHRFAVAGHVRS